MSNILIYEQNDLMRAPLEEWLSEAGYCVHAAASHDLQGGHPVQQVIAKPLSRSDLLSAVRAIIGAPG
jgi:hypothetical protein